MKLINKVFFTTLLAMAFSSVSLAEDCQPRQLPDGTWTTDCPSQSPSTPPPPGELLSRYSCNTDMGNCIVSFSGYVPNGTECKCSSNGRYVFGRISGGVIPTVR